MRTPETSAAGRVRWYLLHALVAAEPVGASETLLHDLLDCESLRVTSLDLRRALAFLEKAGLAAIDRSNASNWQAEATVEGINFAAYETPDITGISRPELALGERR